ncbi:AMP-binding protein [Ramlibacter sp.]|uniref:class I adenylate-forming enzyme family protein n=1 Tax=Ramlibacter sp. TaxID=1917967 RepID=UPI001811271C|nr:AMP-binding protein [Ramlibacter sp.]MBA2673897.1 AMP-binding protein [Ramlibacter sp.]
MSITAALTRHAQLSAQCVAIVFEGQEMSWGALDEAVHRLAAHLAAAANGRPVALHLDNSPALLLLFLAAARSGSEALLLDPAWPAPMLDVVLAKLPDPLLLTSDGDLARRAGGSRVDASLPFAAVADALGAPAAYRRVEEPAPERAFYVGFTSGSTGLPKGYRRSHASWTRGFAGDAAEFGIGSEDVILVPGPMAHSLAPYAIVRGLNAGAKVLFARRFVPASIWRLMARERATVLYCVPTQLKMLLDYTEDHPTDAPDSVRLVLSTGSKWPPGDAGRLKRGFPQAEFCEFYGTSELGYLTLAKVSENIPALSVGRPFPGVCITVRDGKGEVLAPLQHGLVYAESPLMFMSYAYGAEGAEVRAGSAVSVGDVGYFDEDGLLYLAGRANRMVISGGRNIHPEEVEEALQAHPAVLRAAVLGVADALRGERLVALVQVRAGTSRADVIRHGLSRLPAYKVPRQYVLVRDWPATQAGKPDFAALQRLLAAGPHEELA